MITDERDLAQSLRTVDTPPGLTLDPDQVLGRAHRVDRRRRAGRGALATGSVAAVAATALWATGSAVGPIGMLPAAPWTDGCQGIVEGATGASINLDQVSYAELPVAAAAPRTAVVAFDACEGEGGRLAYAALGADGQVGEVAAWTEPDVETLQFLRNAQTLTPGIAPTQDGEVLFGLVASDTTEVRVLAATEAIYAQRKTLPDTGLDAYVSQEFTDPDLGAIGMTWQNELGGDTVVWERVLDVADFEDAVDGTEPLIAQSRDGVWRIWFGDEQANMQGDLGSWLSVDFLEGEGRQVVAYLPDGAEIEVTATWRWRSGWRGDPLRRARGRRRTLCLGLGPHRLSGHLGRQQRRPRGPGGRVRLPLEGRVTGLVEQSTVPLQQLPWAPCRSVSSSPPPPLPA